MTRKRFLKSDTNGVLQLWQNFFPLGFRGFEQSGFKQQIII
ncbi:hypothetical protein GXM_05933 [Nostoc sphaeroides CCNUC1]|uniref:Uncharacterized protein n=1 Tax=Nostoc sphaeroides CCNUC1 TaxID=2653204 RepID=A0A5P8W8Z4_9NOSO|nr:hypothetical protein GXM_05933 [Nostoc sphaeroides CCNUC1]